MKITVWRYLLILCCCGWLVASPTQAQTNSASTAPELNLTLGEQRLRFAPTRSFQEMRLEVVNSLGEIVFTHTTAEAEFDWNLRAGNGEALAPGLYAYRLALKFSAELTRQHPGHFIIERGQDQIWLTASDGAEVSGTALHAARTGGRSVAGLRTAEEKPAKRDVSGRELLDEKGNKLAADKKSAKQEKASLLVTQNRVAKFGAGGVADTDSNIFDIGLNVGIGTTAPASPLTVSSNLVTLQAPPPNTLLHIGAADGVTPRLLFDAYGAGIAPVMLFRRARGTAAAPSAVLSGDQIMHLASIGHGGSGYSATSRVSLIGTAAQNWTNTAQGAYASISTTPNGTTTLTERIRVSENGFVGINTTAPSDRLEVVKSSGGEDATITATAYGDTNAVIGRSANGTASAPTATPVDRSLLFLGGRGYTGSGFTFSRAGINLATTENWTSTNNGTRITFETTPNGSTSRQERMRIDHNGNVGIGTTTPGSRLEVAGAIGAEFQYNLNGNRILHNTGTANLFVGVSVGLGNTTGFSNAFFGHEAGRLNSTGNRNSFFGRSAGEVNTGGDENSFFGHSAGIANTTGNGNAFFGYLAGAANTDGLSNAFFGRSAGASNTGGDRNAFFGHEAGEQNIGGTNNAFFGYRAGWLTSSGNENTFVGYSAGSGNTTGFQNVAVGVNAGLTNTGGAWNTLIGQGADVGSGSLTHATAIGAGAVVFSSNSVVLGRNSDTVTARGTFTASAGIETTSLSAGGGTYLSNGGTITVGQFSGFIGNFPPHVCHADNILVECPSTRRVKDQIRSFHTGMALLQRLRPVTFNWKNGEPDMGLIAEEVAEVEPRLATHNSKTGEINGVKYDHLSAVFINAFNEQQAQIAAQQQQLASLKKLVCRKQRRAKACQPSR